MRLMLISALALATIGASGCMTIGPSWGPQLGASGYVYNAGRATQGFAFPADQVQTAALEAMADLGINSVRQVQEPHQLTFNGRTVDGRHATIVIDSSVTPPVVSARFGWIGDEALSQAFMDRVGIRLGSLPPEAVPAEPPKAKSPSSMFTPGRGNESAIRSPSDAGYRDTPVP